MAEVIQLPKLSDTMEEGTILVWHKNVGDKIEAGELLADIETDKATLELESYFDGVIVYLAPKEVPLPIGTPIAIVAEEGEEVNVDEILAQYGTSQQTQTPEKKETPAEKITQQEPQKQDEGDRVKASPLARRLAREHNIDLTQIKGSGPGGRIIKRDIESLLAEKPQPQPQAFSEERIFAQEHPQVPSTPIPKPTTSDWFEDVPASSMRKTIAKRLSASKYSAPHFYLTIEVDMENVASFREELKELTDTKISYNDILIKACALALRKHPQVNASWFGDFIRYYKKINVGVAVAIEDGLVVPVIKDADNKGIETIAKEMREFVQKARDKKLQPADFEDSTFSISNLGMFGIDEFTAIINPPNSVILAVGQIQEKAVVIDGEITVRKRMRMTLSCDHRVVDGVTGAKFLQTLKELLENPVKMLL